VDKTEDNPIKRDRGKPNKLAYSQVQSKSIINLSKLFLETFMLEYHWQKIWNLPC